MRASCEFNTSRMRRCRISPYSTFTSSKATTIDWDFPTMGDPHHTEAAIPTTDFTVLDRADHLLESPPGRKYPFRTSVLARPDRVLGTFGVVAITYLYGCGGPLGSESIVSTAGPLLGLLGFVVYPIFVTVPYACVVSELSAAFPEDGGFTIWILNAFGPFWSVQVGYWSWVAGTLSIAMYPDYLLAVFSRLAEREIPSMYFIKAALAILLTLPAFAGTRWISRISMSLVACVLLPLVIFVIWGFSEAKSAAASDLLVMRHRYAIYNESTGVTDQDEHGPLDVSWFDWINTLYWNYEGLRMASVFGGQVANPSIVYARAIWIVVGLTAMTYITPLLATVVSGSVNWSLFDSGAYEAAARVLGGDGLRALMSLCSIATSVGLAISGVFCCSTEITGMAENRLIPAAFAIRSDQWGSPHFSILATLVLTLAMMAVDVNYLLPVANTFGSLVAISIFLAAIQMRRSLPYIPRPTQLPGGIYVLLMLSVAPIAVCGYIVVKTMMNSMIGPLLVLGCIAPPLLFSLYRTIRERYFDDYA